MILTCNIRPDKIRLHKELELMKKQLQYNSECVTYIVSKETIEKYLKSKHII